MYPTRTTFTTGTFHPSSRRPTPAAATHRTWGTTPAVEPQPAAGPEPTAGPRPAGPPHPTDPEPCFRPTSAVHPAPAPAAYPAVHPVPAAAPEPPASHPAAAAAVAARSAREATPAGAPYPATGPEPVAAGHPGRWVTPEAVVVGRPAGPEEPHSARSVFPSAPEPVLRAGHPARPEPVGPLRAAPAAHPGPVTPARPAGAEEPYPARSARPADAAPAHRTAPPSGPVAVPAGRHVHPADPPSARVAGPEPVVGRPAGPEEPHPVRAAHPADAQPALRAAHPAEPEAVAAVRPVRAADPVAEPYTTHPADPGTYPVPAAGPAEGSAPRQGRWVDAGWPPARGDVPAARAEAETWTGTGTGTETGTETGPATTTATATATSRKPEPEPVPEPEPGIPHPAPQGTGVPGPGVAEIVARAVARGMDETRGDRGTREEGDTLDIPLLRPPHGTAVTDVPVHLPFRAHHRPPEPPRDPRPATPRRPAARPTAGRRVPRGDDRLREHRGPVLPGWIAVIIGGLALSGCAAVLWRAGVVPAPLVAAFGAAPRAYRGLHAAHWPPLALLGIVALLALGGLGRARAGHAWVLTLFGRYRGTVRRTGLTWISPLLLRQRVDVRLRHWRSEPMPAVDSGGLALQVVVQVVWQVKDTARATLAVEDHTDYLAEQVESAMARVLSQLPADAFHEDAPTLRDAEAVGDALTRTLAAETEAVGIEVFSAQPTRIEYAPEVAEAMRRRRVAAIDAKHRDTVLTAVVDAVDDTVHRLTSRGIVELDDYERKALVKDLTVAFYTGRGDQ
ncbi:SPFH domain-containing protein [Streptomyces sp. AB3(2024)]|uniref:SPFH domain-containing protein n=1 Tax=Streptomyces sp. AB3(2024) TaxID=3317321 RepID=UPI0035A2B277